MPHTSKNIAMIYGLMPGHVLEFLMNFNRSFLICIEKFTPCCLFLTEVQGGNHFEFIGTTHRCEKKQNKTSESQQYIFIYVCHEFVFVLLNCVIATIKSITF